MQEDFDFPIITVDGVIFQLVNNKLTVLLIERAFEPFLGVWALPGGYIPKEETSIQALDRVLAQKTDVSLKQLHLLAQPLAFDAPSRDPRGNAITVMYIGLGRNIKFDANPGKSIAQNPQFTPVDALPTLAYDHAQIVACALKQLRELATSTTIVASLIPKHFTLSELQMAYEAVFGTKLDKRNFRKKILSLGFLTDTGIVTKDGAHRPARLYAFQTATEPFLKSFA